MKVLLILVSILAHSYAGIGIADDAVEAEALRLWEKYCANSNSKNNEPEISGDGKMYVHCKQWDDTPIQIPVDHTTELSNTNDDTVVVFVRPPVYAYQHNVTLTGNTTVPKTIVYVKPSTHNHTLQVNDNRKPGPTQKPTIYYLKGLHNSPAGPNALSPIDESTITTTTSTTPEPEPRPFNPSYYSSQNDQEARDAAAASSFNRPNIYWSPQYVVDRYARGAYRVFPRN